MKGSGSIHKRCTEDKTRILDLRDLINEVACRGACDGGSKRLRDEDDVIRRY